MRRCVSASLVRLSRALAGGLVMVLLWTVQVQAYTLSPQRPHTGQLLHRLASLQVMGRVLYLAAHPDDENTRLLAYLVGDRKVTAGYLSLTRGDGGQNLVGREQASLLGVIRTQELLQARRIDGARQFFTRAKDFGYSKSSKETLRIWDRKKVLADTVWVIRTFRPDVIITRFPEKGRTHGHHLASAQLARAAMTAAADPQRFPEQLKAAKPWKVRRLLYNVSTWRLRRRGLLNNKKYLSQFLQLDVGTYSPLLGLSFGEIAAASRSMHKSQGFGARSQRGPIKEYFQHIAGEKASKDILEGVALSWKRLPGGKVVENHLREARRRFRPANPATALPALARAWKSMVKLPRRPRVVAKQKALQRLMVDCAGLALEARAKVASVSPGGSLRVSVRALNRSNAPVRVRFVDLVHGKTHKIDRELAYHKPWKKSFALKVPAKALVSAPSWLRKPGTLGTYAIPDDRVVQRPMDPAPLQARIGLSIAGVSLVVTRPIRHVWTDRVRGELARRVEIVPPFTVTPQSPVVMFPNHKPQPLALEVRAAKAGARGTLQLKLPTGWKASPPSIHMVATKAGEVKRHRFVLTPPAKGAKPVTVVPTVQAGARTYAWKEHILNYPHIPVQTVLEPARVRLVPLTLKSFRGRVGYIPGSGDFVADALRQVGVDVRILDSNAVTSGNFQGLQTIVTGIRALNKNQTLRRHYGRLLDWVKRGGTLVVQYNTNSWWRPLRVQVGPYPLTIGRARVTDETAPVTPIDRDHPLLTTPHRITSADFLGWVQERGLYFAVKWDPRYQPVFVMSDPGMKPARGSTLVARYGKGAFVYTGISFFRQLPAGVPGAYRLFLNLIAYQPPAPTKAPPAASNDTDTATKTKPAPTDKAPAQNAPKARPPAAREAPAVRKTGK